MARRGLSTQALTGVLVVVLGLLLLLGTTGTLDVGSLWQYVPSLFVFLGLWALYRSGFSNVTGPVVMILVAGTVQLLVLDIVTGEVVATWWPLVVVLFGLAMLTGHWRRRRRVPVGSGDDFDLVGIFGGSQYRVTSQSFRGGAATAIFGGVEVDLREAVVAEPPAVVTAMALFGGVEIEAPDDWAVEVDVLPIFGGVEDSRPRRPPTADGRDGPVLVVTGFVAFGGIEVS